MTIAKIRTLTAFVADQDRAKQFYTQVLGFSVVREVKAGDNRWLEVAPPGAATSIVLHLPFPGMTAGALQGVILESEDLDGDTERLRAAGVAVDGPNDLPWGRQATFADPDGNAYVLSAPAQ